MSWGGFFGNKAPAPAPGTGTNTRPPAPQPNNSSGRPTGSTVGGGQPIPFGNSSINPSNKVTGFPSSSSSDPSEN